MEQLDLFTLKEIQYNGFESLRDEFNMVIPEEVRKSLDDEDFEKGTPIKKGHSRDNEKDNGREY